MRKPTYIIKSSAFKCFIYCYLKTVMQKFNILTQGNEKRLADSCSCL